MFTTTNTHTHTEKKYVAQRHTNCIEKPKAMDKYVKKNDIISVPKSKYM